MKLLGVLWALHVISLVLAYTLNPDLTVTAMLAFIFFGIAYLIQLGREAVKRKRRWIVWSLLGVIIPFLAYIFFSNILSCHTQTMKY